MAQKFDPFVKIPSLIQFHQNMTKFVKPYQYQNQKIPIFLMVHMGKIQDTKHSNIWLLFGHVWKNRPQICTAANIFTWPLLSYAAEESASWDHWMCTQSTPLLLSHIKRHLISR
jgi:hypothetical protein